MKKNETTKEKRKFPFAAVIKYTTAVLVLLVLFWFGFVCQVRDGDCAVVLRFGAVRQEITESGIYLKLPWPFETVVTYDARYQYLESNQLETTTKDKRNVILQSYVIWQIEDPVLYHNSVGAQGATDTYIKDQVFSATNATMGGYALQELVSLEKETIKIDKIQDEIFQRVHDSCRTNYGINVSDVSILRLTLPTTNLKSVFEQMTADRQKDIDAILAQAQMEAAQIVGKANEEAAKIVADGTAEAAKISAEAETEVAQLYAQAQSANLELYQFLMNLDTMVNSVNNKTVLVVKADEYPFNILTKYSQHMTVESNTTVVNDLSYILGQLPEKDRQALSDAVTRLIRQSADKNGVTVD